CPDAAGGAVLGNLLEEVVVGVEEERQARGKVVHVEAAVYAPLDVGEAVGQGEGEFLRCGGACLADVVAGDGDGVPAGHLFGGELDGVHDEAHGRLGRVDEGVLGDIFLQDVV